MKLYKIIFLLIIIVVLLSSSVALSAPAQLQTKEPVVQVDTGITTPNEANLQMPLAITGASDLVHQGTAWVPERKGQFSLFKQLAWGTVTRVKSSAAPTNEWMHIPVPMITRLDGNLMYIQKVEFCARSTKGAVTKPIQVHLRSNDDLFGNYAVSWPADNAYHCWHVDYGTPIWKESLGISILMHYDNPTNKVTLYKAWVRVVP